MNGANDNIDRTTVERIAELARLSLDEQEIESFTSQFQAIVNSIDAINSLDLDGVEPMSHVLDLPNVFRDDISAPSLEVKEALENAPQKNETFFKVPKVIE